MLTLEQGLKCLSGWSGDAVALIPEAREAISDRQQNLPLSICVRCRYEWRGDREQHAPDCPVKNTQTVTVQHGSIGN